jgi:acetyl-CoA synthetase
MSEQPPTNYNIAALSLELQSSTNPQKVAYVCISKNLEIQKHTYIQIDKKANQLANLLVDSGVKHEDHIFIYLPRIIENVISFFGILKTGAVAGVLFSAFEEQALLDRLLDSQAKIVITSNELYGRIKKIRHQLPDLKQVIVVGKTNLDNGDLPFESISNYPESFETVISSPDDNAFMLYTSGSTGKPKGIIHAHRSIAQQVSSFRQVFDIQPNDNYWCTADTGWITGVSYILVAPIATGTTTIFFEGRFDPEIWYSIIQDQKVNVLYTAPTALRMLKAASLDTTLFDFSSLRLIGSVGEPLNTEVIFWAQKVFNKTILDTWFQTELGSITISNRPDIPVKPGSMGKPLSNIQAKIVDDNFDLVPENTLGHLVVHPENTSIMKEVWQNQNKYNSYFKNGWYQTGDIASVDSDGYFFFSGRSDDIINTQGERVGPFEIESALLAHPLVIESAAIGKPDDLRGEIIKAFVVLSQTADDEESLKEELKKFVKEQLGGPLYPREVDFVLSLPKTRSGKIMRRVLKARELGQEVGDLSSLED